MRTLTVRELLEAVARGELRRVRTPEAVGMLRQRPRRDRDLFTSTVEGAAAYERLHPGRF